MKTQIILKQPVINQIYGLVLPEKVLINCFIDPHKRIFGIHPEQQQIKTRINKKNIDSKSFQKMKIL